MKICNFYADKTCYLEIVNVNNALDQIFFKATLLLNIYPCDMPSTDKNTILFGENCDGCASARNGKNIRRSRILSLLTEKYHYLGTVRALIYFSFSVQM